MGFVLQRERYAVEALLPYSEKNWPHNFTTKFRPSFCLGDQRNYVKLYLLGISQGYGTCSLIHGVNVLVLSGEKHETEGVSSKIIQQCSCAVFAWPHNIVPICCGQESFSATEGIIQINTELNNLPRPRRVVELLKWAGYKDCDFSSKTRPDDKWTNVHLERAGMLSYYVDI